MTKEPKEPREPREPKARDVKPWPIFTASSEKLQRTQAKQVSKRPAETKVKPPRPKEPKQPKDYLPARVLSSYAQEVGSRAQQADMTKAVAAEEIAQAKRIRDAQVSRAKYEYEKVVAQHKTQRDISGQMEKISEDRYRRAKKPVMTRQTLPGLFWNFAKRVLSPESAEKLKRKELERFREEHLGAPFRKVWGWQ